MSASFKLRVSLLSLFCLFAMIVAGITLIFSSPSQNLGTTLNISYAGTGNIQLAIANNEGSQINSNNISIVMNEDETKFKIVGPTPIVEDGTTTNLSELTNSSGSEFYYFSSNSNVLNSTSYTEPSATYYLSPYSSLTTSSSIDNGDKLENVSSSLYSNDLPNMTATLATDPSYYTAQEVWYDTPTERTYIYATFMTPTNSDGVLTAGATYTDVIFSHSVNIIPTVYMTSTSSFINIDNCVISNSVVLIQTTQTETLSTTAYFDKNDVLGAAPFSAGYYPIFYAYYSSVGASGVVLNIQFPNSLTKLGAKICMGQNNLTKIVLPDGIASIGDSAFAYCGNLTDLVIGSGVASIGKAAFQNCTI